MSRNIIQSKFYFSIRHILYLLVILLFPFTYTAKAQTLQWNDVFAANRSVGSQPI